MMEVKCGLSRKLLSVAQFESGLFRKLRQSHVLSGRKLECLETQNADYIFAYLNNFLIL